MLAESAQTTQQLIERHLLSKRCERDQKLRVFLQLTSRRGGCDKQGTVQNILSGFSSSARAQQVVTNACGVEIWPGVKPTRRLFVFCPGTEISFTDDRKNASEAAEVLGECVERRGNVIVRTRCRCAFSSWLQPRLIGEDGLARPSASSCKAES